MNFGSIYHRTSDNYCYPLNEEELIINLKTGYDIEKVFLYYGDPFWGGIMGGDWKWEGTKTEIYYKKRLKHHIWWTTTIKPEYKRCKYYFELQTKNETYFYYEDGFYTKEDLDQKQSNTSCFFFPWMNAIDICNTPNWVNDTIWYQIFPERFCNGDKENDPKCVKPWGYHSVTNDDFYGGDLKGIGSKLDYLKDLGITGLYLTPIFESPSSHKYNTTSYENIDPCFGDESTFKELVAQAHQKGIRVMLDGVFNHCGVQFMPWQDVLAKGTQSRYFGWFMINQCPFDTSKRDTKDKRFYSFAFASQMPKLNTNNKEVREYFLQIVKDWIIKYDIDGLRLDVANEVSHKFCKELREMSKNLKPDFYILGEIWHDSISWLKGDEFDAVMNYPLASSIFDVFSCQTKTKEDFEYEINRNYTTYMQQTNDVLFNLLDSHDTNRLIDKVKDLDIFYQQLAILYTMPGSPCIYYGTEIAMEGSYDPDCRRCMPWDDIDAGVYDKEIEQLKALITVRKERNECQSRNFHFPNRISDKRVIEYIKIEKNSSIEVYLNCGKNEVPIEEMGEVLYCRNYSNGILMPKGICIRECPKE